VKTHQEQQILSDALAVVDSEAERPKSPWTPSYSVITQGSGIPERAAEVDITGPEQFISPAKNDLKDLDKSCVEILPQSEDLNVESALALANDGVDISEPILATQTEVGGLVTTS
jgi:hypothetical protein